MMQGIPGSGKSTEAAKIAGWIGARVKIVSTDDRFTVGGRYEFQPEKLKEAHEETQRIARELVSDFHVIVDNCNIRRWHAEPYLEIAAGEGEVFRCNYPGQSVHGVPSETVEAMEDVRRPGDWLVTVLPHDESNGLFERCKGLSEVFEYIGRNDD